MALLGAWGRQRAEAAEADGGLEPKAILEKFVQQLLPQLRVVCLERLQKPKVRGFIEVTDGLRQRGAEAKEVGSRPDAHRHDG